MHTSPSTYHLSISSIFIFESQVKSLHLKSRVELNCSSKHPSVSLFDVPGLSCTVEWEIRGWQRENNVEEEVTGAGRVTDVKEKVRRESCILIRTISCETRELTHLWQTGLQWEERHFHTPFICCSELVKRESRLALQKCANIKGLWSDWDWILANPFYDILL